MNFSFNETNACEIPHVMNSSEEFFKCYGYFARKYQLLTFLGVFISVGTFLANLIIIMSLFVRSLPLTVFDKIIIGHAIVDGLTGLIDIPLFHVNNIFGYWPFTDVLGRLWLSYDTNINTTTSLHMLYMCWVRYRSLVAPKTYEKELLIRHPERLMVCIWAFGLTTWSPVVFRFGTEEFTLNVQFYPFYVAPILHIILWFLPLFMVIVLGLVLIVILHNRQVSKNQISFLPKSNNPMHNATVTTRSDHNTVAPSSTTDKSIFLKKIRGSCLTPQVKFQIIIISFWAQWLVPCISTIIDPLCNCIPPPMAALIYWLTYTVCFTDALIVLILNPNIVLCRTKNMLA